MPTIDDIAADVAQLRRENADLRSRIARLDTGAARGGWRRSLPAVLTSAIAVTGLLALSGSHATAGVGAGPLTVRTPFEVDDASGSPVMTVSADSGIKLLYHNKVLARLYRNTNGGGSLQLLDAAGASEVNLESGQYGGALRIAGTQDKTLAYLLANAGGSLLELDDGSGRRRASLGFTSANRVQFALINAAGNTTALLAEYQQGGYLGLENQAGIARVEEGVLGDDGTVRAFGPEGKTSVMQGK